uniref:Chromosome 10 open reading frame 105 n=1 Tax=Catagonus wagneri TaxID=51154 RepID=A0A8C3WT14_9CETA
MSSEGPSPLTFLTAPATQGSPSEAADSLPVLIALACIFLLLATCLLFMTLCKPAALDPRRRQARECMPHHPGSPSEPQLRLWKRLSSLRRSLDSFRRGRPAPRRPLRAHGDNHDHDCTESTKM